MWHTFAAVSCGLMIAKVQFRLRHDDDGLPNVELQFFAI